MTGLHYLGKPWADNPEPPDEGVWDEVECLGCGRVIPVDELEEGLCKECYESSELCGECGDLLDPNNSENGRCGACLLADHTRLDEAPDDHDRRFSDLYDTLNGDCGEMDPPY